MGGNPRLSLGKTVIIFLVVRPGKRSAGVIPTADIQLLQNFLPRQLFPSFFIILQSFYLVKITYLIIIRVHRAVFLRLIEKGDALQEIKGGGKGGCKLITVAFAVLCPRQEIGIIVVVGKKCVEKLVRLAKILPFDKDFA